ncbi:MAG TPA: aminotransferase class III-fold pyridoxal phosphate-dependent enzyme [Blastocatellia bacterium]|nr:aminotransferase class III-fold pyridoxal phosphate-dependent enzyme [Blastocatellia bacterium]
MITIRFQLPDFTQQDAVLLAREWFGVRANARPLPSERDQNFYLQADDGREYVLKIANATERRELLELQNEMLAHLAREAPSLALPQVCLTDAGKAIVTIKDKNGAPHLLRLLTWVPGKLLAHVRPHTPELLRSLGRVLGVMDRALQNFTHPAAQRELKWDLKRAAWIREYLNYIAQPERRSIVERVLAQYETQVAPRLQSLRASVIYNDANDYNVIVSNDDPHTRQVVGLIDYGDALQSATICNLAIAAAYAMLGKADPLAAAAQVVAGYHAEFPLTEAELAALFPLICTRLAVSVTNSACQQQLEPANEYLVISEKPAWTLLEKLAGLNGQFAHYTLRQACGLPACPHSPAVTEWLRKNADQMGHIVEPDLKRAKKVIFDLSIGSLDISNPAEAANTALFTRQLFDQMREAGAVVGIGRYNEARGIYTSELFKREGNDGPEWRTVHLGLDLFMEAGAPVFAPLDAVVHSFRNNAGELDYGPTIILQHTDGAVTFYTLYGHLSEDSLEGLREGMPISRGTRIGSIGDYPINGDWPPHLHFQIITDLLGYSGDFPGVALPGERAVWLSISPDPNLIAGIPDDFLHSDELSSAEILATRTQRLGPNLSLSYQKPLKIVRGWMQYLYDENGRAYLDAVNNVPHVGHCHPRVVRAGQRQMAVLNTNTRYLHENLARYVERLCATLPEPLRVCFLVNSGSEANELALRLARTHTRSRETIVVDVGYHGNTGGLIEISPYKHDGPGGSGPPPFVHKAPMPDTYRGPYRRDDAQAGIKYAQAVAEIIERIGAQGRQLSAFICESMLSCGGQIVLPDGYLSEVYRLVRAAGGVCIADEVQTGFGRAGSHFHAFETQQVVPDIVTLGKPIGNGHPLGAVITTPEIAASFNNGMEYFNTFGGNPVSCAIGLAVLDVIADEGLQQHAQRVGAYLMNGLRELMNSHPLIGDVRGLGLFIGIELAQDRATLAPAPQQASYIANRMKERGILISTDGPLHNVLKIKPPLVFNEANADYFISTLDLILNEDYLRG